MNKNRLTFATTIILFVSSMTVLGQPLGLHHNSLDWLVIDTPVVVRARLMDLSAIEGHPKLSELKIEVLESIRSEAEETFRLPIETSREASWARRLVDSQNEVLLFLVKEPRGYQEAEVERSSSNTIRRFITFGVSN